MHDRDTTLNKVARKLYNLIVSDFYSTIRSKEHCYKQCVLLGNKFPNFASTPVGMPSSSPIA